MFLLVGAFAFPPLKNWLFCQFGMFELTKENRELAKNWCDFIIICCQIVLVMVVGGIVVTDSLTKWIVQVGYEIREEIQDLITQPNTYGPLTERQWRLHTCLDRLDFLEKQIRSCDLLLLPKRVSQASTVVYRIYGLFDPHGYGKMLSKLLRLVSLDGLGLTRGLLPIAWALQMRFAAAFPGGVQGLFGFAFFWLMLMTAAVKMFMDYPAACVVSL